MFGPRFKASKCKTFLRMCTGRIKLLRNKKTIQINQLRKEIADLLATGKEDSARIRVESVMRELDLMDAYEVLDLFCELCCVRLALIESTKDVPPDMREAIASLLYASPRVRELPELTPVREQLSAKYGKEFAMSCASDVTARGCGVNDRLLAKLSIAAPSPQAKIKLLEEIAAEHGVAWDSSDAVAAMIPPPAAPSLMDLGGEVPASGAIAAAVGMPMDMMAMGMPPPPQPVGSPAGPFAPSSLSAAPPPPPPPGYQAPPGYQPPAFVPSGAPDGMGAQAPEAADRQYAEAVAAAQAAQKAAERAAAAAEAALLSTHASGGTPDAVDAAAAAASQLGSTPAAAAAHAQAAYDAAPGPPAKPAADAPAPSAPPAPTEPVLPPTPAAPPVQPTLPTPPATGPPPPSATAPGGDDFDDLAKRFEALKRRT